jgi:hypothetical protein
MALSFAAASAGNNSAAKMAMMAMTTKSSINVNAPRKPFLSAAFCERELS